jgi:hypothetical protein
LKTSPAYPSEKGSIKMKMNIEQRWNGTDGGKPKYWEKNLSQCHFVHPKSQRDCPRIELVPPL